MTRVIYGGVGRHQLTVDFFTSAVTISLIQPREQDSQTRCTRTFHLPLFPSLAPGPPHEQGGHDPPVYSCLPKSHRKGGYLCSFRKCSSVVVSPHAQHILRAVVEFGKAIELAVLEVNWGLVDPIEGSLCLVGFVHERLESLSTQVKVPSSPQVHSLSVLLDFIFNIQG